MCGVIPAQVPTQGRVCAPSGGTAPGPGWVVVGWGVLARAFRGRLFRSGLQDVGVNAGRDPSGGRESSLGGQLCGVIPAQVPTQVRGGTVPTRLPPAGDQLDLPPGPLRSAGLAEVFHEQALVQLHEIEVHLLVDVLVDGVHRLVAGPEHHEGEVGSLAPE